MQQIFAICVILCAVTAHKTLAFESDYDSAIVDVYAENLRAFLLQNDLETMQLPNFDWFPGKSWNILVSEGSLRNLSTVRWADRATVITNGDVTNILTSLYIPDAHIHYKITVFQFLDTTIDVQIITNALKLDLDLNRTDCTISYNQIEVYFFENIFPQIHLGILDNPLIPRELADNVETGIAVAVKITNFIFNIFIKPVLTKHISQALATETKKFNLCQIFQLDNKFLI